MSLEANMYNPTAADFSKTFIMMVENFGRGFEIGLAGVHNIKHFYDSPAEHGAHGYGYVNQKGYVAPYRQSASKE